MEVIKRGLLEGARKAAGLTVVIDVFRAFSTSCYLFAGGAEKILPVGKVEEAREIAEKGDDFILIGERGGKKLPGFQFGNSPSEIKGRDFSGRTIVLTTSAGTRGLKAASGAEELITGSLVNLEAIVNYIRSRKPRKVTLVPMGKAGEEPVEEDELCACWIKSKLKGEKLEEVSSKIDALKRSSGRRFFEEDQTWSPKDDFYLCTRLDRFDFVLKARSSRTERLRLEKIYPEADKIV